MPKPNHFLLVSGRGFAPPRTTALASLCGVVGILKSLAGPLFGFFMLVSSLEPLKAKVKKITRTKSSLNLELQVNIEGQDRDLQLSVDASQDYGLTGQEGVTELRRIADSLEKLTSGDKALVEVIRNFSQNICFAVEKLKNQ